MTRPPPDAEPTTDFSRGGREAGNDTLGETPPEAPSRAAAAADDTLFEHTGLPAASAGAARGAWAVGAVVAGRYTVEAELGRGGMGAVWAARDTETGAAVALKTLLRGGGRAWGPEAVLRLKEEFRRVAEVLHPNLVRLYELHVADGEVFFSMERVDGVDLLRWVLPHGTADAGPHPDVLARVATAFPQVLAGLGALHARGLVHLDVKPQNVRVRPDGRVVVLDFGLVSGGADPWAPLDGKGQGTPHWMAPEQASGLDIGPAADLYAVGVMLYQVLTGVLPFRGTAAEVLYAKRTQRPPHPGARVAGVPPALDALVGALLQPRPEARPDLGAVARGLGGDTPPESGPAPAPVLPFVGRAAELRWLEAQLAAAQPGHPVVARVEGPSGIGKSELIRRFLSRAVARAGARVLAGRCHPQESVPFKMLDGVVDALARALWGAPPAGLPGAAALARLFPALQGRLGVAPAADDTGDPRAQRAAGVRALRTWLAELAQAGPLVVWVDDAQWGDLDSIGVLEGLLDGPGAPGILWVLSVRPAGGPDPLGDALAAVAPSGPGLALGPLPAEDMAALAAVLGEALGLPPEGSATVVEAAAGSPFLAVELAVGWGAADLPAAATADDRVRARAAQLGGAERALLEQVCVVGGPIPRDLALEMAGLGAAARPVAQALDAARLLRLVPLEAGQGLAPVHDRVREAIVAGLPAEACRARFRAAAAVWEQRPESDPERLLACWRGAGVPARAAVAARRAAEKAENALAFGRAAELWAVALEEGGPAVDAQVRRAEALALAGRSVAAGDAGEEAAAALEAAGADRVDVLELRGRAAGWALQGGAIEPGLARLRSVLEAHGIAVPQSNGAAMWASASGRVRLLLRGLPEAEAEARPLDRAARARLDALWAGCTRLAMVDHVLADALAVKAAHAALDAGDPAMLARALGMEGVFETSVGGPLLAARAARVIARAEALADRAGPWEQAWKHAIRSTSAWVRADFACAADEAASALDAFRTRVRGAWWEVDSAWMYRLSAEAFAGRFADLAAHRAEALAEARGRGDQLLELTCLTGQPALVDILAGAPREAAARADAALAAWPVPGFTTQHYHHLLAVGEALLAAGDAGEAHRRVEAGWPALERSGILRLEVIRAEMGALRARAAWFGAKDARRLAAERKALRALRVGPGPALAALLDALGGAAPYGPAQDAARAAGLHGIAAVAAVGAGGAAAEEGRAWLASAGVAQPAAYLRGWLGPGVTG